MVRGNAGAQYIMIILGNGRAVVWAAYQEGAGQIRRNNDGAR